MTAAAGGPTGGRFLAIKQRVMEDPDIHAAVERLVALGDFDGAVVARAMALGWAPSVTDKELERMHEEHLRENGVDDA